MLNRYTLILSILLFTSSITQAQNTNQFKSTIDTLCTKYMGGRGYVNEGDLRAASYIQSRFKTLGLKKFGDDYYQKFPIPINTFPGKTILKINGTELIIGKDYIINPSSYGGTKSLKAFHITKKHIENPVKFCKSKKRMTRAVVYKDSEYQQLVENFTQNDNSAKKFKQIAYLDAIKISSSKLTASMSQKQMPGTVFIVNQDAINGKIKKVEFELDVEFKPDYTSQNVIGYIEGTVHPDSFIVIGGHYDHLGYLGQNAFFPGANDNASGVSMMLELAEYYSQHQPEKTLVFMAFGGEEVGLIGSKYYCNNPLFDLNKINFMFSLDLFGAGSKGITAVNGTEFTDKFELMKAVNLSGNYLQQVKPRKPTANSDHYFFYKNGVPSFFLYTLGDLTAYHDIYDSAEILEYDQFKNVFGLLKDFISAIDQPNLALKYKSPIDPESNNK